MTDKLTTAQAAESLGVTIRQVQALIKSGRLPAVKFGRDWQINEADLELVRNLKPGRPKTARS